jgi:hypothetical protein
MVSRKLGIRGGEAETGDGVAAGGAVGQKQVVAAIDVVRVGVLLGSVY